METEDLIVLIEESISNLEDVRATLVNLGDQWNTNAQGQQMWIQIAGFAVRTQSDVGRCQYNQTYDD